MNINVGSNDLHTREQIEAHLKDTSIGKYFIHKRCRSPEQPYRGPSCNRAGIEPGKLYETETDALVDAAKLDKVNGVGWIVAQAAEVPTPKP